MTQYQCKACDKFLSNPYTNVYICENCPYNLYIDTENNVIMSYSGKFKVNNIKYLVASSNRYRITIYTNNNANAKLLFYIPLIIENNSIDFVSTFHKINTLMVFFHELYVF